jgi:hypothetical protein
MPFMHTAHPISARRTPTAALLFLVAGLAAAVWLGHQLGVRAISSTVADFAEGFAVGVGLAALLVRVSDVK